MSVTYVRWALYCLLLGPFALGGCDALGDGSVHGRVVDAVTGSPVSPGVVEISVYGRAGLLSTFPPLLAEGETGPDGRFELSSYDGSARTVFFSGTGEVDYPIPPRDENGPLNLISPLAYFGNSTNARDGDLGTVKLYPTCLTLGAIRLARPLSLGEHVRLSMEAPAEAENLSGGSVLGRTVTVYDTQSKALDSLPLLSFGGREARLEWRVLDRDEATASSGTVRLPLCPRHGVLEYEVTLGQQ